VHLRSVQDAGLFAVWKDQETRMTYSRERNETTRFLAWLPSCATASPTVTFAATFQGKRPTTVPAGVDLRADLGVRISPNFIRTPTLKFLLDRNAKSSTTVDLSAAVHPWSYWPTDEALDNATVKMDLADFIRLLTAKTAAMNVFGIDCAISSAQMDALRSYAGSILPSGR
jgi:hypothetical protein